MATIRVQLPGDALDRSYDVLCGPGLLEGVGPRLKEAGCRRCVVVADAAVAASHAAVVSGSARQAGLRQSLIEVPSGEASKSPAGVARLWDAFAEQALDRGTHVVAVGGGVVGDLAGFAAATFARGLPLWHVATTLVAQVDSAIGGKTGINLSAGKNLVGSFWQPRGVFADIDTLATLPDREFVSGLAEVVKYGMILDPDFFGWLEQHAVALLARQAGPLAHAVERSVALKSVVVGDDERETTGRRAILNYGHTFGHAYETAAGYGTLLHGEAVAIGMTRAARLATRLERLDAGVVDRQDRLLAALGLPVSPAAAGRCDPERLLEIMARDKKAGAEGLRFVLPDRVGHVELIDGIAPAAIRGVLES